MPNAEKLARNGQYHEAAQLFEQQATCANDPSEKRRFFDSAGRCFESAGELSSAIACFVKADSSRARDAAVNACIKSGHPEYLSNALNQLGRKEDAIRLLTTCSLNLLREGNAPKAQRFCDEALKLDSENGSRLPDGLMSVLVGVVENDPEKINAGIRICQNADYVDSAVADEIVLFATTTLSKFSNVRVISKKPAEGNLRNAACPKCGAPFPELSLRLGSAKCQFCGYQIIEE